jgi:putative DNA primase/helicase
MTERAFGVGQAIEEAARAREEKERREGEAIDLIGKHITDYLQGGPDREAEDVEIGRSIETDVEVIKLRWKVVRKKRKAKDEAKLKLDAETAASSFLPKAQPIRVESKAEVVKPKMIGCRQLRNGGWEYLLEGETGWRRGFGEPPKHLLEKSKLEPREPKNVVELRVVEQAKPKPVEEEEERQDGERAQFANEQRIEGDDAPLLSKAGPYDNAREFVQRNWIKDGILTLYWWGGKWWEWNGVCYKELAQNMMDKRVWSFLNGAREGVKGDNSRFRPKPNDVEAVMKALRAGVGHTLDPPCWLDTGMSAGGVLVFQNGIVDIETGKLSELTPRLWVTDALDFEYDPEAKCPAWDRFLGQVFQDDSESPSCIEEWLGLGMTEDIRFHKGFLYIGTQGREGKGTLAHIQEKLCGPGAYVSLSTDDWLKGEYSKEAMLYKRAGVFPDMRPKEGKLYGQSYDPGGIDHVSKEWMLKITGGDGVTIRRKWNSVAWEGTLPMKLTLISNEIPNLNDPNLVTRFIKIAFGVSFRGREDIDLQKKLEKELAGIANRCLEGYRRLCRRGRFIQPSSGLRLERDLAAKSNPWEAFFQEECVLDPSGSIKCAVLYMRFQLWCGENGRNDLLLKQATSSHMFSRILRKKVPAVKEDVETIRPGGIREYKGIRLKTKSEKEADEG